MNMTKTYGSEALAAIHDMAQELLDYNVIDKITMREFDEACLIPTPVLKPEEIRSIREKEHLSQPAFARYLNVSKNLVSEWERGIKKPGGPALRLLAVVKSKGLAVLTAE
jgi:putative transcriptional regulator